MAGAGQASTIAVWATGGLALVAMALPSVAAGLHVGRVDPPLLILGAIGAGLLLTLGSLGRVREPRPELVERTT